MAWPPQKSARARVLLSGEFRQRFVCIYVIRERAKRAWPQAPAFRMGKARLALWRYRLRSPLAWLPPCKQLLFLPILGKSNLLPHAFWFGLMAWPHGRSRMAVAAWPHAPASRVGHRTVLARSGGGTGDKLWPHSLASSARPLRAPNCKILMPQIVGKILREFRLYLCNTGAKRAWSHAPASRMGRARFWSMQRPLFLPLLGKSCPS
jgi:hypothetical protein